MKNKLVKDVRALTLITVFLLCGTTVFAQSDPTAIGAGQKPFILILLDSSGSMEYTSEGDNVYPTFHHSQSQETGPQKLDRWNLGEKIGGRGKDKDAKEYNKQGGLELAGPCYVWRTKCSQYERPSWKPSKALFSSTDAYSHYDAGVNKMRDNVLLNGSEDTILSTPVAAPTGDTFRRLHDYSQPRHVQFKEILTGDMILLPRNKGKVIDSEIFGASMDPDIYGPGCWFVPRMHGALINPDASDLCYDDTKAQLQDRWDKKSNSFNTFIDYKDTRPHFQEVFDLQLKTGLMDILEHNVIFAVAMFDGYQGELKDNVVRSDFPASEARPNHPNDGTTQHVPGHRYSPVENGAQTYNLGVYKIVGPKSLWRADGHLAKVSAFTQLAIVDAGYLHNKDGDNRSWKVDPSGYEQPLNISIENLGEILPVYYAGQQSMSGDTPLAAAIYDIHNYFLHGQAEFGENGRPKNYNASGDCDGFASPQCSSNTDNPNGYNPVMNDRYFACRAKHVVMMTDGAPAPEAPGAPYKNDLGTEVLNGGFGYQDALEPDGSAKRYRYEPTEVEIESFVQDPALNPVGPDGQPDPRYKPHVHVVGLNPVGNEVSDANRKKVALKLGAMAQKGGTCAQYWLSKSAEGRAFLPSSMGGTCDPATSNCLVEQLQNHPWDFPVEQTTYKCIAPAVLLSKNDQCTSADCASNTKQTSSRDDMTFVLSLIFNEILSASGGIASRTRPAIAERLDTENTLGQHRVFSGVQVSGASRYWKGLLNRQNLFCRGDDSAEFVDQGVTSLHDEIALQVKKSGNDYQDNRRIFTSFRALEPSNGPHEIPSPDNETPLIISSYKLNRLPQSDDDEFRNTSLNVADGEREMVVGTRVPFFDAPMAQASGEGFTASDPTIRWDKILTVANHDAAKTLINVVRGRVRGKEDRVLGAIVRSNPVVVGPPSRDLPIESYREFKSKYRNRPSMLYVNTLDGLLHGIYTGEHNGRDPRGYDLQILRRDASGKDVLAGAVREGSESQREAWAYAPEMLRRSFSYRSYAGFLDRPAKLIDGSPVVRDVRLCHPEANLNQNEQACLAVNNATTVPPAEQWRTVLVTGLGESGAGYFAMDVTRTGRDFDLGGNPPAPNAPTVPDPVVLWEFDPAWELRQLQKLNAANATNRYGSSVAPAGFDANVPCLNGQGLVGLDTRSFMGLSVGDPEIATVILQLKANVQRQRPVAIFTGGDTITDVSGGCLTGLRQGRAIYIVDLQTGTLLRRFVTYFANGSEKRFEIKMSGTPIAYNNTAGTVANRAFVGDDWSRLFRIDMSSSDPTDWRVELMYDPCDDQDIGAPGSCSVDRAAGRNPFGPAIYRPAVALSEGRDVIVTYGLGRRDDVSFDPTIQAVITLAETINTPNNAAPENFSVVADPTKTVRWRWVFEQGERLTSEPIIFNGSTHFTTYVENQNEPCKAGTSRIYGLAFEGDTNNQNTRQGSRGAFTLDELGFAGCPNTGRDGVVCATDPNDASRVIWVGPENPSLLRGLTATLGPVCSLDLSNPNQRQFVERSDPQPSLIATMGGATPPNNEFGGGNPDPMVSNDVLSRFQVRVRRPRSQLLPLSYVSLGH